MKRHLAAVLLLIHAVWAVASPLPDYPFVHTSGSAEIYVPPDHAVIDLVVTASDADAAQAHRAIEARLADLTAALAAQGVQGADVVPRQVRKELRRNGEAVLADLKCGMQVQVRDLAKWREVMLVLLDKPDITDLATSFRTSERERIDRQLMADALKDARHKAELAAATLGKKLGDATAVSPGPLRNLGSALGLAGGDPGRMTVGGTPGDMLQIQALRMVQNVDVVFRLKNP
jgi:uncharacterized protein YggE